MCLYFSLNNYVHVFTFQRKYVSGIEVVLLMVSGKKRESVVVQTSTDP